MISIIIASANQQLLDQVSVNIRETIGVPYELLAFENTEGKMGICEIYNKGARKAHYDLLCFMHEDVLFETTNWGRKVADIFSTIDDIGLLGVAGSTYKSLTPSSWAPPFESNQPLWRINIKQSFKRKNRPEQHDYRNPENKKIDRVACIDGVWMCSKREIIIQSGFDEELLNGFHGYDVDISLAISQHHTIFVSYEILLKHLSEGNFEGPWLKEVIKVHRKWIKKLPVHVGLLDRGEELCTRDQETLRLFLLEVLPKASLPIRLQTSYIHKLFILNKINRHIYIKSIRRVIKHKLKKNVLNKR